MIIPALADIQREKERRRLRGDFYAYRNHLDKKMKDGWWQRDIAMHLSEFKRAYFAGEAPRLVIQAPPQHGKSVQIVDFISWIVGLDPSTKCIYASFSERLGVRANLKMQRIITSKAYREVFPNTSISAFSAISKSVGFSRNREFIEFIDQEGSFRNTTVRGAVTGESLDLGVIDDPIKGREEANSPTIREKTWDWMMDDFFTRFSERGALLVILTRWHVDDPIGRLIQRDKSVKVLSYKAIAEADEEHRKAGEALFPEHKSVEFLEKRKSLMAVSNWEALYQQNPIVAGGNLFKTDDLQLYDELPPLQWRALYVDTAQKTKEKNDYSVIQHWGRTKDGKAYLIDQLRAKFEAPELEAAALAMWMKARAYDIGKYGSLRKMAIEDKVSGTGLIQSLKRKAIPIVAIQRNKDKYTRALDVVPYVAAGLVNVPKNAVWLKDYVSEMAAFPEGAHDDCVDPTMDALLEMCGVGLYTLDNL
jgi:predicted phage terminase large subunit-like protein